MAVDIKEQGWPDFFDRGPNLKDKKYSGLQKTEQKLFGLFSHF